LLTDQVEAQRTVLLDYLNRVGMSKFHLPAQIISVDEIPMKGAGKVDYQEVTTLAASLI
jgi:non-ribosomal peptide synthetase component E (peptide arylation enzyme)